MELVEALSSDLLRKWLNPHVLDEKLLEKYRQEFTTAQPFPHLYIDDFLLEERLEEVAEALTEQEFEMKESDLFQLAQTLDFDDLDNSQLLAFKNLFRSQPFLRFMEFLTGIDLSTDVDCLGNIYQDTDYLLCHDDKLVKRKVAYIFYLTDLLEEDGGALHLFDNEDRHPTTIVKSIQPRYNRLTFFQVTRASFHEVGEVLGPDIYRVSISGWFNNPEEVADTPGQSSGVEML